MDKQDLDLVLSEMRRIAPFVMPGSRAHMRLMGVAAVLVAHERQEVPFRADEALAELEEIEFMVEVPTCLH